MNDLMAVLPAYFRPVREFQELMVVDDATLKRVAQNVKRVWDNFYIQTADSETLSLFEERFDIVHDPEETLDYRRQRILQKYNTIVPFSIGFLRSKMTDLFGNDYKLAVYPQTGILVISVTSSRYGAVDLLYDLLWDIVPAHMQVFANQQVSNYISGSIYVAETMSSTFIQTI